MLKTYCYLIFAGAIAFCALASCNTAASNIPFPVSDTGNLQPVTQPLKLNAAKQFQWLTVKTGGVKSVVKKLDVDALPSSTYDSTGFKPFKAPPEESHFDFSSLPDTAFSMEKLKAIPFQFKAMILPRPVVVKASPLSTKLSTTLDMTEIGKAQGIVEKAVISLMKDKNGFIWIGTEKGLYRYDGEYLLRYQPATTAVSGMIEDNDGRLWVLSDAGIAILDFAHGIQYFSNKLTAPFPRLPKMFVDDNGKIWATQLSDKGIIAVIDPQTQTYKVISKKDGLSGTGMWTAYQDKSKNIWIATNAGADIINAQKNKISYLKSANGLGSDSLRAITEDSTGKIWIAYLHGGVNEVDIKKGSIKRYGPLQGFNNVFTYRLLNDSKGKIWMATDHGLFIVDPKNGLSRSFIERDGIPEDYILDLLEDDKQRILVASYNAGVVAIAQNAEMVHPVGSKSLSTLMEDKAGRIWVGAGTSSEGIEILDKDKRVVRQLNKQHGLADNFIQNFAEVDGNIWIATDGGFDIIDLTHKTLEHTGKKEGLASDTMYAVIKDRWNNIWFSGPSLGIDRLDSARKTIQHAGVEQGLTDANIVDMKIDKQGRVWIASYRKGVDIIDLEKSTVQNISQAPGLRDTCYRILMPDDKGNMWIGSDKGVYVVNTEKNSITSITTKEGLCNNYITSLLQYKGMVVAGTRNKVSIITPPGNKDAADTAWKVALMAGSEGLINGNNSWSTNIITRSGQYIWGDAGITIVNEIKEQQDTAVTYVSGVSVMTQPLYFVQKPALSDHDTLWTSDSFYVKGQQPTNAGFAQQPGIRFDSITGPYNLPVNLHIPYDQNYMQFQFSQHHSGRLDATQYQYVLEGVDKKWSNPTTNSYTENYLNLSPGDYTFKVRSKSISGLWGSPASFSFTITPPWWKTWWAYTLMALAFAAVLRAYIVYRSRKLQRENKLLEEKVNLRTMQLQKSIEDLKATQSQLIQSEKMASLGELTAGIAHEIQNPLNFINNFSEVNKELLTEMKEEIDNGNATAVKAIANDIILNEEKINHHGRRADAIVKSMLQHSRSNSNTTREPVNINKLADEYLRLAYHGLRAKDKSFNATLKTDYDERLSVGEGAAGGIQIIPQDIGRVVLNLITNAFYAVTEKKKNAADKVSGDKYEPTVTVSTKKLGDKVEIKVADNGGGIPQRVLDKIFQPFFTTKPTGQGTGLGLSLSYDIVKAHGGELRVETREGEGSEFIIQLPIN